MSQRLVINRQQQKLINQSFQIIKRGADIAVCILAAPIILPVLFIIAILIKKDSSGPVFFKQERIGRSGKRFMIYKFRTMYHDTDKSELHEFMKQYIKGQIEANNTDDGQASFKPPMENQVTKIGNILRKTSADELPNLINVFKGEMSLVGPRPNVPWEVDAYDSWHNERLEVKPGITGLAQVKGRSGIPFNQLIKYDVEYVRNKSIWLDIKIFWWTIASVLQRHGAG